MITTSRPADSTMVTPAVITKLPVTLDAKGRGTSKAQRRIILAEFAPCGLSAAQFARRTGLKHSTWGRQCRCSPETPSDVARGRGCHDKRQTRLRPVGANQLRRVRRSPQKTRVREDHRRMMSSATTKPSSWAILGSGGVVHPFSQRQSVAGSIASALAIASCVIPSCRRI